MNKLIAALVAGLFAAGAFAQTPAPAPKPAHPVKAHAKKAVHKVKHVAHKTVHKAKTL